MVVTSKTFTCRNHYTLVALVTVVTLFIYVYNCRLPRKVLKEDKLNKCTRDIDGQPLHGLPADKELHSLDDDSLYLTFHKYIRTCQFHCHNVTRLGPSTEDSGKNVCTDERFSPKKSSCLVYSFGSNFNFKFEEAVWKNYQCEIHTFDPSRSVEGVKIPTGVHFHLTGLSGKNFVRSSPETWRAVNKDSPPNWNMQTLSSIRKTLNHTHRVIDVLKIDIEGWEWDTLNEIMKSGVLKYVKQICLEVHFGYGFTPVYENGKAVTVEFTSEKWGNTAIPDQLNVLRHLYEHGLRIFMYDPITGWGTRHIRNPEHNIDTLVEISLVNINMNNLVQR